MRKEELLIVSKEELEKYYKETLGVKPKDSISPSDTIVNVETIPIEDQINNFKKNNGFGMLVWIEAEVEKNSEPLNVKMIFKTRFVWIKEPLMERYEKNWHSGE